MTFVLVLFFAIVLLVVPLLHEDLKKSEVLRYDVPRAAWVTRGGVLRFTMEQVYWAYQERGVYLVISGDLNSGVSVEHD